MYLFIFFFCLYGPLSFGFSVASTHALRRIHHGFVVFVVTHRYVHTTRAPHTYIHAYTNVAKWQKTMTMTLPMLADGQSRRGVIRVVYLTDTVTCGAKKKHVKATERKNLTICNFFFGIKK